MRALTVLLSIESRLLLELVLVLVLVLAIESRLLLELVLGQAPGLEQQLPLPPQPLLRLCSVRIGMFPSVTPLGLRNDGVMWL